MVLGLLLQVGVGLASDFAQAILDNIDEYHASQSESELVKAAKEGELKDLESALRGSCNIDEMKYDMNPLMYASKRGRIDMVEKLLEKGASPHVSNFFDNTPLREAIKAGHEEIVKLMLRHTCGGSDFQRSLGFGLIQAAQDGRKYLVELLLKSGADVNAHGRPDSTDTPTDSCALLEAAQRGYGDIVRLLLDCGANINCESSSCGNTALICAAAAGHATMVKLLLDHNASATIKNVWGQTALQVAEQKGYKEIVQLIERYIKGLVEQLVRIMMRDAKHKDHYNLFKYRKPNDYQALYNLVITHPELMQGIIHDGRTFAMLCVERGYADLLVRIINENWPIDFATPCNMYGPHEPQTTVLHRLFGQMRSMGWFKDGFPEDYVATITELTKLIINKYPNLLDIKIYREQTARARAWDWGVAYLIPHK